jgi:transcription-repair coupling factor (superfamily II helicase)
LPVKTYVSEFDEELLKSAIAKEVSRSGQTFVLHNKVEDIEQFANYLKNLVPNTRIQIAHGQMPEGQLEKVILQFIRQEFSVLVCTTIIESGIDMPHVNTLVVDSADRFGLGQLYQIRGRVGRSDRQAYAYFFTPSKSKLSEDAKDRLQVLQAHQALGSGFQVAHHDLDIRGAGTLLGAEQSGRIADVGSELYTSMLEEAIRELEDKDFKARTESEVKFKVAAQIPAEFIESESIRLDLYRRIFKADDSHELMKTQAEARERFGELPVVFDNLFLSARLKLNLQVLYIKSIQHFRDDVFSLDLTGCPSNSGVFQTKVLAYIKLRKDHFALQGQAKILIRLKVEWSPSDPAIQKASLEELNLRLEELLQAAETF